MKPALLLIGLFYLVDAAGQDSLSYMQGSIYKKGAHWRMNGHKLKPKQFKAEIYKVPESVIYYKKARVDKLAGWGSVLLTTGALLLMPKYKSPDYLYKENPGLYIVAGIGAGFSFYFSKSFNQNLRKAVKTRNEKIASLY